MTRPGRGEVTATIPRPRREASGHSVVLVGDRFAGFTANGHAATASDFVAGLRGGRYDSLVDVFEVELGQGVDASVLAEAEQAIAARGLADHVLLRAERLPTPVEARMVHKRDPRNVLLAGFERCDDRTFEAALCIHNDNELLLDHQTASHVQGMVLAEAARQMFLAACESCYARRHPDRSYIYLLTALSSSFARPVFPISARLRLTAHRADLDDPDNLAFAVSTEVWQAGRRTGATTLECLGRPADRVYRSEQRAAAGALTDVCDLCDISATQRVGGP